VKQVVEDVENLYFQLGITEPSEIDIEAIAFSKNAEVRYSPLKGCEARIIGFDDKAIITLNSDSPLQRQRFSLGHELGHWLKDRGRIGALCSKSDISENSSKSTKNKQAHRENIANTYASELLMPGAIVEKMLIGSKLDFDLARSIADSFNTSLTAAAIRIIRSEAHLGFLAMYDRFGNRRWFQAHPQLTYSFYPPRIAPSGSGIRDLIDSKRQSLFSDEIDGEVWCKDSWADGSCVHEETVYYHDGTFLTLVWWEDEEPIWRSICQKEGIIREDQ